MNFSGHSSLNPPIPYSLFRRENENVRAWNAIIICVLCIILGAAAPKNAGAQEVETVLSPSIQNITTRPGKSFNINYELTNSGDPQSFTFLVIPLGEPDLMGNFRPLPSSPSPIKISTRERELSEGNSILILSRQKKRIPVRITVPSETPDGEYAFAVAMESRPGIPAPGTVSALISQANASLVLIRVTRDGFETKAVRSVLFRAITDMSIPIPGGSLRFTNTGTPVPLRLVVTNLGKYSIQASGELVFSDRSGTRKTVALRPSLVFPGADRVIAVPNFSFADCLKNHDRKLCREDLSYVHEGFPMGIYDISASLRFGGDTAPRLYSRDYLFVVPYWLLFFITGFFLLTLGISTYLLLRWYRKYIHSRKSGLKK
ncbi:MAG: hypothetical protein N2691_05520 [Patescibacteria group bacterium]|nr:hypothetical protein [Patescibacteria group bacterium]